MEEVHLGPIYLMQMRRQANKFPLLEESQKYMAMI